MSWHLKELIRDSDVASVASTTAWSVETLLNMIDLSNVKVFVEFGPGDGAFTSKLLEKLAPQAKLIAIETNPIFVRILRKRFRDPRLNVILGSALDVNSVLEKLGVTSVDYFLSGIPLSFFSERQRERLLIHCKDLLTETGGIAFYQSVFAGHLKHLQQTLKNSYSRNEQSVLPFNFPPLIAFLSSEKKTLASTLKLSVTEELNQAA
jgi:phospholipid N-methyltransferase